MPDEAPSDLFEGKKYWIAQRVPSRNRWIELLEKHGGHLVKLDTQADILIADHARKGAPAGSLSWRYIEESVKQGELQDPVDHPAGPLITSGQGHAIPSRPSATMARMAYTAEDDRQLWDWVIDAEKKGARVSGNNLYKELAAINPRHTWHSWRDRWLKSLSQRPRPATRDDESSPEPAGHIDPPPVPQNVGRRRAPSPASSHALQTSVASGSASIPSVNPAQPQSNRRNLTHIANQVPVDEVGEMRNSHGHSSISPVKKGGEVTRTVQRSSVEASANTSSTNQTERKVNRRTLNHTSTISSGNKAGEMKSPIGQSAIGNAATTSSTGKPATTQKDRRSSNHAATTSPTDQDEMSRPEQQSSIDEEEDMQDPVAGNAFTDEDRDLLVGIAESVEAIDEEQVDEAWKFFAKKYNHHTDDEWRNFWHEVVRPPLLADGVITEEEGKSRASIESDEQDPKTSGLESDHELPQELTPALPESQQMLDELTRDKIQDASDALVGYLGHHESPVHFDVLEEVCGHEILLYDICRAVTTAFDVNAEVQQPGRWEEVAQLLGIDKSPQNAKILRKKFMKGVAQFFDSVEFLQQHVLMRGETEPEEEILEEYEEADSETDLSLGPRLRRKQKVDSSKSLRSSVNVRNTSDEGLGRQGEERFDEGLYGEDEEVGSDIDLSLEPKTSNKRRRSTSIIDVTTPEPEDKRPRVDNGKGKEIELLSSPEAYYVRPKPNGKGKEIDMPSVPSSPEVHFRPKLNGKGKEIEIPSSQEVQYRRKRGFDHDPETQDFHFPPDLLDEESEENSREDSPSNQIHEEANRAYESSPQRTASSTDTEHRIQQSKRDRFIALGYEEDIVRDALYATTSNERNAAMVMEELRNGNGIPDNVAGVWTIEDDALVEDDEGGGWDRMVEKHGLDNVEERLMWLEFVEELKKEAGSQ